MKKIKKNNFKLFKAIFHVNEQARLKIAVGNIVNLIKDIAPEKPDVELVINGSAISIFTNKKNVKQLEELYKQNIKIIACRNSINMYCKAHPKCLISEDRLPKFVKIVNAGISELISKQSSGYAYIKP